MPKMKTKKAIAKRFRVTGTGKLKKEFYGFNISSRLEEYLFQTESLVKGTSLGEEIVDSKNKGVEYKYILSPILSDSETIGLVFMVIEDSKSFTEEDEHIIQIIANFLSKYLED